jgi:hypothetical protein
MARIQTALDALAFIQATEVHPCLPARFFLRDATGHQVDTMLWCSMEVAMLTSNCQTPRRTVSSN